MKAPAVVFLFALLSAALGADDRLIPLDEFSVTVPVTKVPNPQGLEVKVWITRPEHPTIGGTGISVHCMALPSADKSLDPDDRATLMDACAAAVKGQDFRKELLGEYWKTVYEVVTVEGQKCVRIGRVGVSGSGASGGGDAFMAPEEGARLKEALVQAAAAESWYKMLLTARTPPAKTAEAHPPKAKGYIMYCKLDVVHGEGLGDAQAKGLDYMVLLQKYGYNKGPKFWVDYSLGFVTMEGTQELNNSFSGEWVKRLMEQVALALDAVGEKKAFTFESPADEKDHKYSVTANLAAQRADVALDILHLDGTHTLVKGSFAVAQLAQIRAAEAQRATLEKWFAEHEAWFFEGE